MTGQPDDDDTKEYSSAELRMARRKARRMGLNAQNGKAAIEMLKARGISIDDEQNYASQSAPSEDVAQNPQAQPPQKRPVSGGNAQGEAPQQNEPQKNALPVRAAVTKRAVANQPEKSRELDLATHRAIEVAKLEEKIRRRRLSRFRLMMRKFFAFVILPTMLMACYFIFFSTPLYSSKSEMTIQKQSAASASGTSAISSLFQGTAFGNNSDSAGVQTYLQSREAFSRLEEDYPFSEHFMTDQFDFFTRLSPDATEKEKYENYLRYIRPSFDNTDMVIRLEVRMADPVAAGEVSNLLLNYAEENLDEQTQRMRDYSVADAQKMLDESNARYEAAKVNLLALQQAQGRLSTEAEVQSQVAIITDVQQRLAAAENRLVSLKSNAEPNEQRVMATEAEIELLKSRLDELNAQATGEGEDNITALQLEVQFAEQEVLASQMQIEQMNLNVQNAISSARAQMKFIAFIIKGDTSFAPVYPKIFQSILASFLIFFGLYLFIGMTVEILREQITN